MYIIPLFYAMAYIFTQVVIQHDSEEVISQAQTASLPLLLPMRRRLSKEKRSKAECDEGGYPG